MGVVKSVKMKVRGEEKFVEELRVHLKNVEDAGLRGMVNFALYLRKDMDRTPPKIPVKHGNLRASSYVISSTGAVHAGHGTVLFRHPNAKKQKRLNREHSRMLSRRATAMKRYKTARVELGFTAWYSTIVHENTEAMNWTRPNSGPFFLSAALKRNASRMPVMIKKEIAII